MSTGHESIMYWYIQVRYGAQMAISPVMFSKLSFSGLGFAQNTALRTEAYSVVDCMYREQPYHVLKHIRGHPNLMACFAS